MTGRGGGEDGLEEKCHSFRLGQLHLSGPEVSGVVNGVHQGGDGGSGKGGHHAFLVMLGRDGRKG